MINRLNRADDSLPYSLSQSVPYYSNGVNQKTLHQVGKVEHKEYVDSFHNG